MRAKSSSRVRQSHTSTREWMRLENACRPQRHARATTTTTTTNRHTTGKHGQRGNDRATWSELQPQPSHAHRHPSNTQSGAATTRRVGPGGQVGGAGPATRARKVSITHVRKVRPELQGLPVARDGLLDLPAVFVRRRKVAVRVRKRGAQLDGGGVAPDRLVQSTKVLERVAHVAAREQGAQPKLGASTTTRTEERGRAGAKKNSNHQRACLYASENLGSAIRACW